MCFLKKESVAYFKSAFVCYILRPNLIFQNHIWIFYYDCFLKSLAFTETAARDARGGALACHVQDPGIYPSTSLLDFDFVVIDILNCPLFYPLLLFFSRTPRDRKTGTKPCLNRSISWTEVPVFIYISHVILWEFVDCWLWACYQFIWLQKCAPSVGLH